MIATHLSIAELAEGQSVGLTLAGTQVLLCLIEGQYFALPAQCPHAGKSLVGGTIRGYELTCPMHGATFDVRNGACLSPPADQAIATFAVMIDGGKVYVDVHGGRKPPTKPIIGPIY